MRRLLVVLAMVAASLLALAPAAQAAPALSVSGSCNDSAVPDALASRFTGMLSDYQFVQLSETEIGLAGTLTGTCELLVDFEGTIVAVPFAPQRVTLAGASWSLDCPGHRFGYGVSAVSIITQGTMWVAAGGSTTVTGATDQQNRDICKAARKTMTDNTTVVVRVLNDLLAAF
jgi:hypothetical protein